MSAICCSIDCDLLRRHITTICAAEKIDRPKGTCKERNLLKFLCLLGKQRRGMWKSVGLTLSDLHSITSCNMCLMARNGLMNEIWLLFWDFFLFVEDVGNGIAEMQCLIGPSNSWGQWLFDWLVEMCYRVMDIWVSNSTYFWWNIFAIG